MRTFWSLKIAKFDKISLRGVSIYVLRDDLISGAINGNKARKLAFFMEQNLAKFDKIISYGSSQSNAMFALSVFAKLKKLRFIYVCEHLSEILLKNPSGNLKFALQNGMELLTKPNRAQFARNLRDKKTLFIEEGVCQSEAEFGFKLQAKEISDFAKQNGLKFDIFLPSATGTSAAYLAKNSEFAVFTTPCVGDENYLKSQIFSLDFSSKVKILNTHKKYHFAKPKAELYDIWSEVCKQSGIEFELIYDPVGFMALFENLSAFKNQILYIHQGGTIGNISQKERYFYKGLVK